MNPVDSTAPPPEYDDSTLGQDIDSLRAVEPTSAEARLARDALIKFMKLSQNQTFSKEIAATMKKSLALKESLEKLSIDITVVNDANADITGKTVEATKTYSSILWATKESVTRSAGANCLGGFIDVILELAKDEALEDGDVIEEIKFFISELPKNTATNGSTTFGDLRSILLEVIDLINGKIAASHEQESAAIKSARAKVVALEAALKRYKIAFRKLIPAYLKVLGFSEDSPKFALYLALSPNALLDLITAGLSQTKTRKKIDILERCQRRIDDTKAKIVVAQQGVAEAIKASQIGDEKRASWSKVLNSLELVTAQVDEVEPSLEILDKVTEAVSGDANTYLAFLQGNDAKDASKREEQVANLEFAALLYSQLIKPLKDFANA